MRASPLPILLAAAFTAFAAFVAVPTAAWADPLPPAAKAEVKALLDKLIASSCEFNRNGDWYSAAEAKSHLERKLKLNPELKQTPTSRARSEAHVHTKLQLKLKLKKSESKVETGARA